MRRQHDTTGSVPRDRAFWIGAGVLVLGQLVAFWMLCSHQVRLAETRHASVQVERLAVADCLRSVPNATFSSCAARVKPLDNDTFAAASRPDSFDRATPVNYVYH